MRQTLPSNGEHLHVGDGAAIDVAALVLGEGAAIDVAAFVPPGEGAAVNRTTTRTPGEGEAVNGTAGHFGESEFHFGCWIVVKSETLDVC